MRKLADCMGRIHRRTPAEGDDTDHVAALPEALAALRTEAPRNALKTVFLLTDGKLDVSQSPDYGRRPADRAAEAERGLRQQLDLAQRGDLQIWPLGFAPEVNRSALDRFARGGSRRACDARPESQPQAQVVKDSREVRRPACTSKPSAGGGRTPMDLATLRASIGGDLAAFSMNTDTPHDLPGLSVRHRSRSAFSEEPRVQVRSRRQMASRDR